MLADDFAPQLNPDELAALTSSIATSRPVVVISATPTRLAQLQAQVGTRRSETILRELALLVRRNLREMDAVALTDDELIVMLDAPMSVAQAVSVRLLAAVRAHRFAGGAGQSHVRLTLSMGMAAAPEHGAQFAELMAAARVARSAAGVDNAAAALTPRTQGLDLDRFVGRAEPLAQLTDSLDDIVRGVARVVAVVGETGVGSSSLIRALSPEVRLRGGSLVTAACREQHLPEPYAVWNKVLRAVRRLPVKSTRQWRELPLLEASLERASDEQTRGGSKMRLLEELADFLRLAAQQRPLLFLLDDMQWADAASWDALEYLTPQLESERILFALTIRTGEQSDDALERWAQLRTRPHHAEIKMSRLTRDDVKRLVEGAMGRGEAGHDLLAYLYRHTEGNPLHLVHLLRDLEESGHLAREGERWRWSNLRELPPMISFDELVARRLSRLPSDCRTLLELTATLDREFEESFAERVGEWTLAEVREHIRCAVEARLLAPTFDRDRASYVFSHSEVARAIRERLSPADRVTLHQRVAIALASSATVSESEIASHFEAAGRSDQVYQHAMLAADAVLAVYEPTAAASLLNLAARHAVSSAALAGARARMAAMAEVAGRYEEAEALCGLALSWYESEGDKLEAIRVKRMLARVRMQRGQSALETLDSLVELVGEAERAGADEERAAILLVTSQMLARLGEPEKSQQVAEECVAIAERCADPVLLADSYNRLAINVMLTDAARARELFVKALDLVAPLNEALRRARIMNNIGSLELSQNRYKEARARLTAALAFSRTASLSEPWGRAALNLGVLEIRTGNFKEAFATLGEALRVCAEAQHAEMQIVATYNLASLTRDTEDYRRAGDTYEQAMELAERIGQSEIQLAALGGAAYCRLSEGKLAEAIRLHALLEPRVASRSGWFQGREVAEALAIRLAMRADRGKAAQLFKRALALADTWDVYGAVWLTAEIGPELRESAPEAVDAAVEQYGKRPEVAWNPRMRERFGVLMLDSAKTVDRI